MKELLNDLDLTTTKVENGIGQKLDQYLTRLEAFGFSGAMHVSIKNRLVLNKGYGYANREKKIQNSPEIFYLISSISKHFTSIAILQLEMQDKLRVSDSIAKHLPGVPKDKERIT
ncbi:MAG: serine hydrolase, partial [Candidatus Heimdallarchaeota archaeon]|nr:serine hydrolase [Candidatus Heimdallarchaeota archaeon]